MTETRVLIVEDEPPARAKLRRMLAAYPDLQVVAEAENVAGALAGLRNHRPDLLFLDIQLGTQNGFDVLARAAPPYPLVVFTTAYQQYALRAFEVAALDYLLKPFDAERFQLAMRRVFDRLAERRRGVSVDDERLRHASGLTGVPGLSRLVVRERGRNLVVPLKDVHRFSAAGNYVEVHTQSRTYLIRAVLSRLAQRLDPLEFLRVHRSHLVRADQIAAFAPLAHGDALVTLRNGSELTVSRRYRILLRDGALPG